MLDQHGRLQLSDKAPAINCQLGMGGLVGDRPIFVLGHFFKTLCSWRDCFDLTGPRQRLQIGLGDSNMFFREFEKQPPENSALRLLDLGPGVIFIPGNGETELSFGGPLCQGE